jgi:hypothetical protein
VKVSVPLAFFSVFTLFGGAAVWAQEEGSSAASASTQPEIAATNSAAAELDPSYEPADRSKIVYVSDFDLDLPSGRDPRGASAPATSDAAVGTANPAPAGTSASGDSTATTATPRNRTSGSASGQTATSGQQELKKEETPAERVARFVDFVSNTLVKELEKKGYVAKRMRPGERPDEGLRISGVFAEADEQNRWRRAVIGGPNVGQMALFVSIGNLARPDQALYAVVDPKTAGNGVGPVITVSAYAPVARFEMSKIVTEKAVRDTATAIVADLTQLLRSNIAMLTQ